MVDTKISQSGSSEGGPEPMRDQCGQGIIDRVICQQFLILFDATINTGGYLYFIYPVHVERYINIHTDIRKINKEGWTIL